MPDFFFPSSSRPSSEAVCRIRRCGISIDFSDGKTLRSLDLSERFRGAESDNEKRSRGWGRGVVRFSPPPTVMLACPWVSSTGVVACLCVDELLLWPCERCRSSPRHPRCCFSERGRCPGALCMAPHRWLIPLLAALVGGSAQGPRRLIGP